MVEGDQAVVPTMTPPCQNGKQTADNDPVPIAVGKGLDAGRTHGLRLYRTVLKEIMSVANNRAFRQGFVCSVREMRLGGLFEDYLGISSLYRCLQGTKVLMVRKVVVFYTASRGIFAKREAKAQPRHRSNPATPNHILLMPLVL